MQLPLLILNWTPLQSNATPQNQTFLALPEKNHPYQFLLNRPVGSYELVDTLQTPELGWPATWHYKVAVQVSDPSSANVFAQAQVQQAASQPAQVPVAKTSPSISSGLSSFGDRPPTSPQPNYPRNTVEQPPGLQQSPQRLISEVRQGQGTAQNTQSEASSQHG